MPPLTELTSLQLFTLDGTVDRVEHAVRARRHDRRTAPRLSRGVPEIAVGAVELLSELVLRVLAHLRSSSIREGDSRRRLLGWPLQMAGDPGGETVPAVWDRDRAQLHHDVLGD